MTSVTLGEGKATNQARVTRSHRSEGAMESASQGSTVS